VLKSSVHGLETATEVSDSNTVGRILEYGPPPLLGLAQSFEAPFQRLPAD
jgi:hypothetical protein